MSIHSRRTFSSELRNKPETLLLSDVSELVSRDWLLADCRYSTEKQTVSIQALPCSILSATYGRGPRPGGPRLGSPRVLADNV